MLDVKTARDILPLVNTPDFEELFNLYLSSKKHDALRILEQSEDEVELYRAQGAIAMLKKLKSMRLEVQTILKGT
jgi:hypothetical protein|tara:strand:- start:1621 stop:1845 length:225 start_codon:yes stop_codon:yes gene_type:complete